MSAAAKIARLESLLARVTERKSAPRTPAMMRTAAPAPAPTAAPKPAAAAPSPSSSVESWGLSAPDEPPAQARTAAPAPMSVPARTQSPPASSAVRPPVATAVDQLPDLDFDEGDVSQDKRPSLMPAASAASSQSDHEAGEFVIPSHRPPPHILPPSEQSAAIELETGGDSVELELDHSPLASVVPPRLHRPEEHDEDELVPPARSTTPGTGSAAGPMASAASVAAGAAAGMVAGVVAGVAASVAAVSGAATVIGGFRAPPAPSAPADDTVEEIEPEEAALPQTQAPPATAMDAPTRVGRPEARPEAPAISTSPERIAGSALPAQAQMVRIAQPSAAPARPATFRALLERSLALQVK